MRVLITGSQGKIGRVVTELARAAGHEVRSFDRAAASVAWEHIPGDILNLFDLRRAMTGCEAVIHLAAIPSDWSGQPERVFETNVMGTWNMLQASAETAVKKMVSFSSVNALGIWGGQRRPDYLPVDDSHPHYPRPAYGLSKHIGEDMCESFTQRHGFSTYCLRPCYVSSSEQYEGWARRDPARLREWMIGDYYSYVDVRDVARAAVACLEENQVRHGRYLLTAAENAAGRDSQEILREDYADIPWRAPEEYLRENPRRSLVDTSAAWRDLGWKPEHLWQQIP